MDIVLLTGGLGFIGKHFVRRCLQEGLLVKNVDLISYAADLAIMKEFENHPNYRFIKADIRDMDVLPQCDVIVNFAAESHVDNSITSSRNFCTTNFLGVQNLMELARHKQPADRPLFVQISTDEVYGDIAEGRHAETNLLVPSNPYSATKAAADMLVKSWGRTYGLDWNIIRPTNNYGMHQYPEKLIPKSASRMKRGLPAIMHGDGTQVRTWLHAEDTVEAVMTVLERGERNMIYNVGGAVERRNIDVIMMIAKALGVAEDAAFESTVDRSGQDIRYSLDDRRIRALGWQPKRVIDDDLHEIVHATDITRFA